MALINCPECNKEISDKAYACPQCAHPLRQNELMQQSQQDHEITSPSQSASMTQHQAVELGQNIAAPMIEQQKRTASGGATGALIGAALGYFLMASSCGMPESIEHFTMTLFFWSPVILLGMLIGYFFGKAL
jgi:hypothetical protein